MLIGCVLPALLLLGADLTAHGEGTHGGAPTAKPSGGASPIGTYPKFSISPENPDEGIGSLPSVAMREGPQRRQRPESTPGSSPAPAPTVISDAVDACTTLIGEWTDLSALLVDAWGAGSTSVLTLPGGVAQLQFHGPVNLTLDARELARERVQIHVWTGIDFAPGSGLIEWNGLWTRPFELPAVGSFPVPAANLLETGLLATGSLTIGLWGPEQHTTISFQGDGSTVHLIQKTD